MKAKPMPAASHQSLPKSVPTLFITLGDPFSINLWALARLLPRQLDPKIAYVMIGDEQVFGRSAPARLRQETYRISSLSAITAPGLYFLPSIADALPAVPSEEPEKSGNLEPSHQGEGWVRGLAERERGRIAAAALMSLTRFDWTSQGTAAVLTCPIDKKACNLAGFGFPGQTEFFEQLWGKEGIMVLAGHKLRVGLVTNHLALSDVPAAITTAKIVTKAEALLATLGSTLAAKHSHLPIAVCGLNPHCSDGGLFGTEDAAVIAPAVSQLNSRFPGRFVGPLPADTVFFNAYEGRYSAVLAMYHDQGLAPLKTVHFFDAINITGGLEHLRVSPDHGPAADLFASDHANTDSFALAKATSERYLTKS